MRRKFSLILCLLKLIVLEGQVPNTELWLFKIETSKSGMTVVKPLNLTKREGYDNQPSFSPDSKKIFYVSVREDKQADIYQYDLKHRKTTAFTKTPISEYSPALTPDHKFITSVVVENDSSQFIHFINPLNGIHETKLDVDSVGYYTFLSADTVVYYKLTEPHSLRYHVKSSGEDKWLGNNPTRAFKPVSRNTLIYGLKDTAKITFYSYNFLLRKAEKFAEYPSLNEDFLWHPLLGLIKSEGLQLLAYNSTLKEWKVLFDLSAFGLKKITRFDIDPKTNYLVVADNL